MINKVHRTYFQKFLVFVLAATALSGCSSWNFFGSPRSETPAASPLVASTNRANWIIDGTARCAATNPYAQEGEVIRWYGHCRAGKLDGYGTLIWYRYGYETERNEGMFSDGDLHGAMVTTHADGNIIYGEYDKGLRNGLFVVVNPHGRHIWANYRANIAVRRTRLTGAAFERWRSGIKNTRVAVALQKSLEYFYGTRAVDIKQYTALKSLQPNQIESPFAVVAHASGHGLFDGPPGHQPIQPLRRPRKIPAKLSLKSHESNWQYQKAAYRAKLSPKAISDQEYRNAADRLFVQGYKYERSGQTRKARENYDQLLLTYPSAPAAVLASNRLKELISEESTNRVSLDADRTNGKGRYVTAVNSPTPTPNNVSGTTRRTRSPRLAPVSDDLTRTTCSRDGLYESNSKWCGIIVGDDGHYYKVRVNQVSLRGFGTIGIDRSVCTGNVFLTWFSRGVVVRVPKNCMLVQHS